MKINKRFKKKDRNVKRTEGLVSNVTESRH